jgi:hypothetical protein
LSWPPDQLLCRPEANLTNEKAMSYVERLRASRSEFDADAITIGTQCGTEWAKERAEHPDLLRLSRSVDKDGRSNLDQLPDGAAAGWLGAVILGGDADVTEGREFLANEFGECNAVYIECVPALRAFRDAALLVFASAKV